MQMLERLNRFCEGLPGLPAVKVVTTLEALFMIGAVRLSIRVFQKH